MDSEQKSLRVLGKLGGIYKNTPYEPIKIIQDYKIKTQLDGPREARRLLKIYYLAIGRNDLASKRIPLIPAWRALARTLHDELIDGAAFVQYFVAEYRKRHKVSPTQTQVCSPSITTYWVPRYRRSGAAQYLELPTHNAGKDQKEIYRNRRPFFGRKI